MIMKTIENYKFYNLVMAIILLFTCPLVINKSIPFLPILHSIKLYRYRIIWTFLQIS